MIRSRRKKTDRTIPSGILDRMAALDEHEQVALRDGHAVLEIVDGCTLLRRRCICHEPSSDRTSMIRCTRAVDVRSRNHRRSPRYCRKHWRMHRPNEPLESAPPRIVALSDELWQLLEIAWHQLARIGDAP